MSHSSHHRPTDEANNPNILGLFRILFGGLACCDWPYPSFGCNEANERLTHLHLFLPLSSPHRHLFVPPLLSRTPPTTTQSFPWNTAWAALVTVRAERPLRAFQTMKAFLNKLKLGSQKDKEKDAPREKIPQLGPLPDWPPTPLITATPGSVKSYKPLPELSSRQLPPIEQPPALEPTESSTTASSSSTPTQSNHPNLPAPKHAELDVIPSTRTQAPQLPEPIARSVSKATTNTTATITTTTAITVDVNKKVAFISPSTTPSAERPLRSPTPTGDLLPPMKKIPSNRPGRPSTTGPASSRTDLSIKSGKHPAVRATTSPNLNRTFADNASIQQTIRSNTPYSQSNSSRIMSPASWSELTEDDLVANLGSRERTRQEVLYEIVSSEER